MMFIGYYVKKFFASGVSQRKSISLERGLQNGTLAVYVASQLFNDSFFNSHSHIRNNNVYNFNCICFYS